VVHLVQPVMLDSSDGMVKRKQSNRKSDKELLQEYGSSRGLDTLTMKAGFNLLEKV